MVGFYVSLCALCVAGEDVSYLLQTKALANTGCYSTGECAITPTTPTTPLTPPAPTTTSTTTRHLQSKSSRIAIIGAGPSGIHMASFLKRLGYEKTTLLEKTDRVGGKSFTLYRDAAGQPCQQGAGDTLDTVNCTAHDMGTCFFHNDYAHVRHLMKTYGLKADIETSYEIDFNAETPILTKEMFAQAAIVQGYRAGALADPGMGLPEELSAIYSFLQAVWKHNALYDELFGAVDFTLPNRPTEAALQAMNMVYHDLLAKHQLLGLLPFVQLALTAQGYGRAGTIPAYYGLVWMKPELFSQMAATVAGGLPPLPPDVAQLFDPLVQGLLGRIEHSTSTEYFENGHSAIGMLAEGWEKIWQVMFQKDQLDVRFNVSIMEQGIQRPDDGPISITYSQNGGQAVIDEYDILIYTAPHALAHEFVELTPQESHVFQHLNNYVLMTTIYKSGPVPGYDERLYRIPALDGGAEEDGEWYGDRIDGKIFGKQDNEKQMRVSIQFYESPCQYSEALCDAKYHFPMSEGRFKQWQLPAESETLANDIQQRGGSSIELVEQFPWPYFWHFSKEAITAGKPWDLFDMQGTKNTFWLGASAVFESAHDVVNLNLQILDVHFGGEFKRDRDLFYNV